MIPEHFYMTGLGKIVYLLFYLPLILVLFQPLYRKFRSAKRFLIFLNVVLLTLPLWDVYLISLDAEQLCRDQGGLHVYKTVEADGFLGDPAIEIWSKYGFKYVEGGDADKMTRSIMKDGKVFHERVKEFISRYHAKTGDYQKSITMHIERSSSQVIDLKTGEVLGELVYFSISPGVFDSFLMHLTAAGPVVWFCGNEPLPGSDAKWMGLTDVILATIKPAKNKEGAK